MEDCMWVVTKPQFQLAVTISCCMKPAFGQMLGLERANEVSCGSISASTGSAMDAFKFSTRLLRNELCTQLASENKEAGRESVSGRVIGVRYASRNRCRGCRTSYLSKCVCVHTCGVCLLFIYLLLLLLGGASDFRSGVSTREKRRWIAAVVAGLSRM